MTTSRRSDGHLSGRMQGKSCLNLAQVDDDLCAELELLAARAARAARSSGFPIVGTDS